MKFIKYFLFFSLALVLNCSALADKKPVKVFILAGQSNMEGKGGVDPLLNHQIDAPETRDFFAHLRICTRCNSSAGTDSGSTYFKNRV